LMLAVWPVMIAYSRFGWDASQSVLATLPVVYLSLATVRFPVRRTPLAALAGVAMFAAVWVHPTNLFAGGMAAAAVTAWPRRRAATQTDRAAHRRRRIAISAVILAAVTLSVVGCRVGRDAVGRWLGRARGVEDLVQRGGLWHTPPLLARLHTGATTYEYIPGSRSWLQWPAAEASQPWGVDVAVFWAGLIAAGAMLWRAATRDGRGADRVLLAGWGATLLASLVVAGPSAMLPGWERYALCLVGPTTLVLARGGVLAWRRLPPRGGLLLAAAALLGGGLLLSDFRVHYFGFFRQNGGEAHPTFRTGPVEPRAAALELVAGHRTGSGDTARPAWLVASEWWNCWTLKYLAAGRSDVQVVRWEDVEGNGAFRAALGEGRVWLVAFPESAAEREAVAKAADALNKPPDAERLHVERRLIRGYGGRPALALIHVRKPCGL